MSTSDKVKTQRKNALKFALIGAVGLCASGSITSYAAVSINEVGQTEVQNPSANKVLIKDGLKPGVKKRAYPDTWGGDADNKSIKKPGASLPGQRAYLDVWVKNGQKPKVLKPNWPGALQKPSPKLKKPKLVK